MPDPKVRALVDEIRVQLAGAKGLSANTRRSLEVLVRDLEGVIERPAGSTRQSGDGLRDRVTDAVRRLEASHPMLSTTLGNVVDTLAFFGI